MLEKKYNWILPKITILFGYYVGKSQVLKQLELLSFSSGKWLLKIENEILFKLGQLVFYMVYKTWEKWILNEDLSADGYIFL